MEDWGYRHGVTHKYVRIAELRKKFVRSLLCLAGLSPILPKNRENMAEITVFPANSHGHKKAQAVACASRFLRRPGLAGPGRHVPA
jgi:hypothetical protein